MPIYDGNRPDLCVRREVRMTRKKRVDAVSPTHAFGDKKKVMSRQRSKVIGEDRCANDFQHSGTC